MPSSKGKVIPVNINDEMKHSYLDYAMSVIVGRALPDVRDGLKPVHRRILYAMNSLGLTPDKNHRKSAYIVGEVLAKYHPHGDVAVYDALVRLAQDFACRYPLVDGHGNFGSVDGDSAAAMRYTEARLARISLEMLSDIDKNTVDFIPNYDERTEEPTVLPARIPNLLVNGSAGIAVGMATNIPPHNLGEVIDGVIMLIDNPDADIKDLMSVVKGPDFPTAGLIMGREGIWNAYRTGRGSIKIRARVSIEPIAGGKHSIIVTEIPYQVNKARLIEKIAELVKEKTGRDQRSPGRIGPERYEYLYRIEEGRQPPGCSEPAIQTHPVAGYLRSDYAGAGGWRTPGSELEADAFLLPGTSKGRNCQAYPV